MATTVAVHRTFSQQDESGKWGRACRLVLDRKELTAPAILALSETVGREILIRQSLNGELYLFIFAVVCLMASVERFGCVLSGGRGSK